jgi:hypothetical protein
MAPIPATHHAPSLWQKLADRSDAPTLSAGDVWRGLERRLTIGQKTSTGMWEALATSVDPQLYHPQAIPDIAEEQVVEGDQTLVVICSPRGNYLRLTPIEHDLWHQMDGTLTIQALAMQAFVKHRQLVPVGEFVDLLKREGFLMEHPH